MLLPLLTQFQAASTLTIAETVLGGIAWSAILIFVMMRLTRWICVRTRQSRTTGAQRMPKRAFTALDSEEITRDSEERWVL